MYSARHPAFTPKTSSPGLNSTTFLPTASTVPAKSDPGVVFFGAESFYRIDAGSAARGKPGGNQGDTQQKESWQNHRQRIAKVHAWVTRDKQPCQTQGTN